jgi:ferric-dicitrate binding protein FerR (iron transport regulator)
MPTITGDEGLGGGGYDYSALARYFAGECGDVEMRAIDERIVSDPEFAAEVEGARVVWTAARGRQPDVESALRRVMAPAVGERAAPELRIVREPVQAPVSASRARVRLAVRDSGSGWLGRMAIAAGIVMAIGASVVIASRERSMNGVLAMREYSTAAGERLNVTLDDGTQFTLAPESRLRVPVTYGRATRDVALEGEAFFRVVHDEARPFRVRARNTDATDVGTAFDVRAYATDTAVQVAVAEGRVGVSAGPTSVDAHTAGREQRMVSALGAGDLATISEAGRIGTAHNADLAPYIGWTAGELVFRDTPLRDVVPVLERWYGVRIVLTDPALGGRPIYATYGMRSMTEVLTQVTSTIGAHYTQHGRTITFVPGLMSTR